MSRLTQTMLGNHLDLWPPSTPPPPSPSLHRWLGHRAERLESFWAKRAEKVWCVSCSTQWSGPYPQHAPYDRSTCTPLLTNWKTSDTSCHRDFFNLGRFWWIGAIVYNFFIWQTSMHTQIRLILESHLILIIIYIMMQCILYTYIY